MCSQSSIGFVIFKQCLYIPLLCLIFSSYSSQIFAEEYDVGRYLDELHNPDAGVRREAVFKLGMLKSPEAALPLIGLLKNDRDPDVRMTTLTALRLLQQDKSIPLMIEALKDDDANVRRRATNELEILMDKSTISPLLGALRDKDSTVRIGAVEALGNMKDASALSFILKAMKDKDAGVRIAVAKALGRFGSLNEWGKQKELERLEKKVVRILIRRAVYDSNFNVRKQSLISLRRINDPSAAPGLVRILADKDESIRLQARTTLKELNNRTIIPRLIRLLQHPKHNARHDAAYLLGGYKAKEAKPALEKRLRKEKIKFVRDAIEEAIGKIGGN